jgi:hypothetical protein
MEAPEPYTVGKIAVKIVENGRNDCLDSSKHTPPVIRSPFMSCDLCLRGRVTLLALRPCIATVFPTNGRSRALFVCIRASALAGKVTAKK